MRTTALLTVALIALAAAAPLAGQSLADVARKEEERRKEIKTPAKVLTNKDLADVPPATAPPPSAASTPGATPSTTPAASDAATADKDAKDKEGGGKDQKYWSTKLKSLQDALAKDQNYADAMQTRINALTRDFVNEADPVKQRIIGDNRQKSIDELNRLTAQAAADKKAIDDFQEEARRAGVPPGWLR